MFKLKIHTLPIIQVKGLRQYYHQFAAVNGISFEVYPGEIFGLIGTNGAGKTSTMKALGVFNPLL